MSLSSSLNAGVAGLSVNATRLAVISDNIANSSTKGYRRADVDFSSLVTPASSSAFTAGGVNVSTFRDVASPGSLINTSNPTDISIAGKGLLPVTPANAVDLPPTQRPFQLVATGSFAPDEAGVLMTPSGLALTGWPTDANGNLLGSPSRDSAASLEPVRITPFQTAAEPTTQITLGVNLPAAATEAGAPGTPYESPIEYFDSVGRAHQLRVVYTPEVPASGFSDTWRVAFFDSATSGAAPIAELDLNFDSTRVGRGELLTVTPVGGAVFDPATGVTTVNVADGPIEVQLATNGNNSGVIQLDSEFAPTSISKNGAPAGNLASLEIDGNGFLKGVYDTGQRRFLYQVPLADVPNPNGLEALSNQAFALSPDSGDVFLWDANNGPVGAVEGFALQDSTVDVARELTDLIQTQRAYSSNATIIQTVDEMLQETTNLKR